MAHNSRIEWCDDTWNPVAGCSIVSPGCTNCYAMKTAHSLERRFASKKYAGLTKVVNGNAVWTGEVRLDEAALRQPLHWKKPRRVFVNSMSDLFHESLPDEEIDRVFAVMALCPQHQFQCLTKRAERMQRYMDRLSSLCDSEDGITDLLRKVADVAMVDWRRGSDRWPLPNCWLGVSAERQQEWDERKEHLRNTPAAVRFASFEPLLGQIIEPRPMSDFIQWAIVGGESGPKARPLELAWARSIVEQCRTAEVACFVKQLGDQPLHNGEQVRGSKKDSLGPKGKDMAEWPVDLRIREMPNDRDVLEKLLEKLGVEL